MMNFRPSTQLRNQLVLGFLISLLLFPEAAGVQSKRKRVRSTTAKAATAQKLDQAYTAKIREYTTEPFFLTELVDHLPASDKVPTPQQVLGHIIGSPEKLTYVKDIHRYLRELTKASPRVAAFTIGHSEEGREMLLVAISDGATIRRLDRYREITAKLADPRTISDDDAEQLITEGKPMYWLSGSIHSPETGSPEMLMELAYRLAVEETPFIQTIRRNAIVLITPVTEVDGRDRYVDIYNYRKKYPHRNAPGLLYWGHYVAHDNNRDGMSMALALTRAMMKTFLAWHPQVLHDLHESVPFLYISTGTGPYNAWIDPILVEEWQLLAHNEVGELTRRGVPGVWTHGFYDGWAPNYMFYVANGHNAIGRFYETYGGIGADTMERTVRGTTTRAWYRPNPPLPKVKWSIRNNINLQQSGVLLGLNFVARNKDRFLRNFYLKSKRAIAKATNEGPAAWVVPIDDPRPVECANLVNLLRLQGAEVHRADQAFEVKEGKFPAGSYIIRMDQPYSRIVDMLLDKQYYNPEDSRPYDDTGWTLGALRNVKTVRVTDRAILKVPMTLLEAEANVTGQIVGSESTAAYLIKHNTENALVTLCYRLKEVTIHTAEASFKALDRDFPAGSFIIKTEDAPPDLRARLEKDVAELGLTAYAVDRVPEVPMHKLTMPRIAILHTWQNTQNEGWYRIAFEDLEIPYAYISDHDIRDMANLRQKYDVIIFPPVYGSAQRIVDGLPMNGEPIPWKTTELTPNIGRIDSTDDMRGGMGLEGLIHLKTFVEAGGLFITIANNGAVPIDFGLVEGVSITRPHGLKARGSIFNATVADKKSPITYGYGKKLAVYFNQSPVFRVSRTGGLRFRGFGQRQPEGRPTGRGSLTDPDIPQGRPYWPSPKRKREEEEKITPELREALRNLLPPPEKQPRVVLRFAPEKELLVSGMLAGGKELAKRPAIIDVPVGKGHIVMFAINPVWRQETQGSFCLLFNAALHFDHLGIGRKPAAAERTVHSQEGPGPR